MKPLYTTTLLVVMMVCSLGAHAASPLYFGMLNADAPTMGQQVRVRVRGWDSFAGDPSFETGDTIYFQLTSSTDVCATTAPSTANSWTMTLGTDFASSYSDVVIKSAVFAQGSTYVLCYIKTSTATAYKATASVVSSTGTETATPFAILGSMYTSYTLSPAVVYAGQGPITMAITEADQTGSGRAFNQGGMSRRPYLIACPSGDCTDREAIVALCESSTGITSDAISGYTTTTLTATLILDPNPQPAYVVCVPYCYKSGSCGSLVSWALVDAATPITIQAANPSLYSVNPNGVEARMDGYISLVGSGLTSGDTVRLLASGEVCASSSAALMSDILLGSLAFIDSTSTNISFSLPTLPASSVTGQVCYSRSATPSVWAPVYQTTAATTSDFVVLPMQPTTFQVSPTTPTMGQTFTVSFTGTGLDASVDAVKLVYGSSIACTVTSTSDPCDGTDADLQYFDCATRTASGNVLCDVTVDPPAVNDAANLCVCYKKQKSSNYGVVSGTVDVAGRNPVYTITPFPFYPGQQATLTIIGENLSPSDTLKLVAQGAGCTSAALTTVSVTDVTVVTSGVEYEYGLVGSSGVCFDVCMLTSGQWTVSHPVSPLTSGSSCPSTSVYITPLDMRVAFSPAAPTAFQTVVATFSASALSVSTITVVQLAETCATSVCTNAAPCSATMPTTSFTLSLSTTEAILKVGAASSYVVCANVGNGPLVPVQQLTPQTTGQLYTFNVLARSPVSITSDPTSLRIAMQLSTLTFEGTALSNVSDSVRLLSSTGLLDSSGVCPQQGSVVTPILRSPANSGQTSATATSFVIRGTEELTLSNNVAHVCYYDEISATLYPTYMGSLTFRASNPTSVSSVVSGAFRAGKLATLEYPASSDGSLSTSIDSVFFYINSGTSTSSCRCEASSCNVNNLVTSTIALTGTTAQTSWRNPLGFTNYAADVNYTVCYTVGATQKPTYLGEIRVLRAHPTYYSVGDVNGRVGAPLLISATTLCSTCTALSSADSLILVLNDTQCADVTALNPLHVEAVGDVSVTSGVASRRLVPLITGQFRVCYKVATDSIYTDLTYTSSTTRQQIIVSSANPAAVAVVPVSPSAGQYLIVNLTNCVNTQCDSCSTMRLVPGTQSSCWVLNTANITSTTCTQTSRQQDFPRADIPTGEYTVCYGTSYLTSRRVPGSITIAAANPLVYNTVSDRSIYTNQATQVKITLSGTGLSTGDSIFVIPKSANYHCHDLRSTQFELIKNATEASYWLPSTIPYPLTISSGDTTATWTVSDSVKRFSSQIISASYCSTPGVECELVVCYLRSGTSWATVPPVNTTSGLVLYPSNPQSVTLDNNPQFRVTQYALATVIGTDLLDTDELYFSDGLCESGTRVVNTTATGLVNTGGTQWQSVVRFIARNSDTVRACYTKGATTTEIPSAPAMGSILADLRYVNNESVVASDYTFTQYSEWYGAGALSATTILSNIANMNMVSASSECNYPTFPSAVFPVITTMSKTPGSASYFYGRLLGSGDVALCFYATTGQVFRVTSRAGQTVVNGMYVGAPNPTVSILEPTITDTANPIMAMQLFNITFTVPMPRVAYPSNAADTTKFPSLLQDTDTFKVIAGSVYDCGFSNTTIVGEFNVTLDGTTTSNLTATATNIYVDKSNEDLGGDSFTICYKTVDGTHASVPIGAAYEKNLRVGPLYPAYYSTVPGPVPQTLETVTITFYPNTTGPLTALDGAKIVQVANSRTGPLPSDCLANGVASTSTVTLNADGTTQWAFVAPTIGLHTVCYKHAGNSGYAYVPYPGLLTMVPRESPYGFTTDAVTATASDGSRVLEGERFHIFFSSVDNLQPRLEANANTATNDSVRFSTTSDCATPVTAVSEIPTSYAFADPAATGPGRYLHLRFRTTGTLYICYKRFDRSGSQVFADFTPIGISPAYQTLIVEPRMIASVTVSPTTPRARIPSIIITPTYQSPYTVSDLSSAFVVAYPHVGITAADDDTVSADDCYRATASEAISGTPTDVLVNSSNELIKTTYTLTFPFSASGKYKLCYISGYSGLPASMPSVITVAEAVPLYYEIPTNAALNSQFSMRFIATDPVLLTPTSYAHIHMYTSGVDMSCADPNANLAPGTAVTTTFGGNDTVSTMDITITSNGTFYVCFQPYDQFNAGLVPRNIADGSQGYVFSIGIDGPASYVVFPTIPTAGETLTISVTGENLGSSDVAKIVDVSSIAVQTTYSSYCTDAALSLNAANNDIAGTNVSMTDNQHTTYSPRTNATAVRVILCYQTPYSGWVWVPSPAYFQIYPTNPSYYELPVSTDVYGTQHVVLSFSKETTGTSLTSLDEFKVVVRGSGENGFDCNESATLAPSAFVAAGTTTSDVSTRKACSSAYLPSTADPTVAATWTVCYKKNTGAWAEVPYRASSTATAQYGPLNVKPLPFSGYTTTIASPRVFQEFTINYAANLAATYNSEIVYQIGFVQQSTLTICDLAASNYSMVQPIAFDVATTGASVNIPEVAVGMSGSYYPLINIIAGPTSYFPAPGTSLVMLNSPVTIAACSPCSYTPTYSYPESTHQMDLFAGGVPLDPINDRIKIVPADEKSFNTCNDATNSRGAFAGQVLRTLSSVSTTSQTSFTVVVPTEPTDLSTVGGFFFGDYYVCYQLSTTVSGRAAYAAVGDATGAPQLFSVVPFMPKALTSCPVEPYTYGQTFTLNFTKDGNSATHPGTFDSTDQFFVMPATAGTCNANSLSATSTYGVFSDTNSIGWATFDITFPYSLDIAASSYTFCYKTVQSNVFAAVLQADVNPEQPRTLATLPRIVPIDVSGVLIELNGTNLKNTDDIFIIDMASGQTCFETCRTALISPSEFTNPPSTTFGYSLDFSLVPTSVRVTLNEAIHQEVILGVCYRQEDSNLHRLRDTIRVGPPNPQNWTTNFVPRVGTQPTITFAGEGLSSLDTSKLVPLTSTCSSGPVTTTNAYVTSNTTTSDFTSNLEGTTANTQYRVCYSFGGNWWVEVAPLMTVFPNPIASYTTSNTPMIGRATEVTFPDFNITTHPELSTADEAKVVCGTCSCFTSTAIATPYGSTTSSVPTAAVGPFIRMGLNESAYTVCYRISDSGFAKIGASFSTVATQPAAATLVPATAFKGQRLQFTLTSSAAPFMTTSDNFMVVTAARLCWDQDTVATSGIVSNTAATAATSVSSTVSQFGSHVPSLGPDMAKFSPFPLGLLVCVKEAGQLEYAHVGYVSSTSFLVQDANPADFSSTPTNPINGYVNVTVVFSSGVAGDMAYAVAGPYGNRICDDSASEVLSTTRSTYPTFTFTPSTTTSYPVTFCYIKVGGTVAEVPRQMSLQPANPQGWSHPYGSTQRIREYLDITVTGTGLSVVNDILIISSDPCEQYPIVEASYLGFNTISQRQIVTSTQTMFTLQVLPVPSAPSSPRTLYMCYNAAGVWYQVPRPMVYDVATPTRFAFSRSNPRAGQHIKFSVSGLDSTSSLTGSFALPLSAATYAWCSNYTAGGASDPSIRIADSLSLIDSPYWSPEGLFALCTQVITRPVADIDDSLDLPSSFTISAPNPTSMSVYPVRPHVGQKVTFTIVLSVDYNFNDRVKMVNEDSTIGCDDAALATGHQLQSLTAQTTRRVSFDALDSADPLGYESFTVAGMYTVCYYSATENVWSAAGATLIGSRANIEVRTPGSWIIYSGLNLVHQPFSIGFQSLTAGQDILNASVDRVWGVPITSSCAQTLPCTNCLNITLDTASSNSTISVTNRIAVTTPSIYNLCYQLKDGTPAMVPGAINITTGEIRCFQRPTTAIARGSYREVTIELLNPTVDITGDQFLVSAVSGGTGGCQSMLQSAFPPNRASVISRVDATVTYGFEWPLTLTNDEYSICYYHMGVYYDLCDCDSTGVAQCTIPTAPAVPSTFSTSFFPVYVGQRIQLSVSHNTTLAAISALKFVSDTGTDLSTCQDSEAWSGMPAATRVNTMSYTSNFKYSYTRASMELLVCVLMTGETHYRRVPAASPYNNVLFVRPFFTQSVFPDAQYHRALETLNVMLSHTSRLSDDVVSTGDRMLFVEDPLTCDDSLIDGQAALAAANSALFVTDDTDITVWPGAPKRLSNVTKTASIYATWKVATPSGSKNVLCYRPNGGTWAAVNSSIVIGAPIVNPATCNFTSLRSPSNGADPFTNVPAWQYSHVTIDGANDYSAFFSTFDRTRVVPQSQPCAEDSGSVYDSATLLQTAAMEAIFLSPSAGLYKLCYQVRGYDNVTLYSPMCPSIVVQDPVVVADLSLGCFHVGQTLVLSYRTYPLTATTPYFTASDSYRIVEGSQHCDTLPSSDRTFSSNVAIDRVYQSSPSGSSFTTVATHTANMGSIFLGSGTSAVRFCYRDAAGHEYAVPVLPEITKANLPVARRHTASYTYTPARPQSGQLILVRYESSTLAIAESKPFTPAQQYTVPFPATLVAVDVSVYDAQGLLPYTNPATYLDGDCAAAATAPVMSTTLGNATNTFVYGNADVAVLPQYHLPCYQLAKCNKVDVGAPFRIYPRNPANGTVDPNPPRRGQLFTASWSKSTIDATALDLTPGLDRGAATSVSCWSLDPLTGGVPVKGNTTNTYADAIVYAEAPEVAQAVTVARSCYKLNSGSWSDVIPEGFNILAAIPRKFEVFPPVPTADQLLEITFDGTDLGTADVAKIVPEALNCTDAVLPQNGTYNVRSTDMSINTLTGGYLGGKGWPIQFSNTSSTTLLVTTNTTGRYSVCYKRSTDTRWTLVYGVLTVNAKVPSQVLMTPATAHEGELFTLSLTNGNTSNPAGSLGATDTVMLIYGASNNCLNPDTTVVTEVTAGPARTDQLPSTLDYRFAIGRRGLYTMCYIRTIGGRSVATSGYPLVSILDNPESYSTLPGTARVQQVFGLYFIGQGLQSAINRSDSVKILAPAATTDVVDSSYCTLQPQTPQITVVGIKAYGNYSVATVDSLAGVMGVNYIVCYKLFGGQYYPNTKRLTLDGANPVSATPSKSLTGVLTQGEGISLTLQYTFGGYRDGDFVFVSRNQCRDVPVTAPTQAAASSNPVALFGTSFQNSTYAAIFQDGSDFTAYVPLPLMVGAYHLCYRSPKDSPTGSTSYLTTTPIQVLAAVPAPLTTTLSVAAKQIFQPSLTMTTAPTTADALYIANSPSTCGNSASQAAASTFVAPATYNVSGMSMLTFYAAVPATGTYYICYAHRVAECDPVAFPDRNCGRIIGVVSSTAASPADWALNSQNAADSTSDTLSAIYPNQDVKIRFLASSDSTAPALGSSDVAWLAPVSSTLPAMWQLAVACVNTVGTATTTRYNLSYTGTVLTFAYTGTTLPTGYYGVCYQRSSETAALPRVFPPVASGALRVLAARATGAQLITLNPTVSTPTVVAIQGDGIGPSDTCFVAGAIPDSSTTVATLPATTCTDATVYPQTSCASLMGTFNTQLVSRSVTVTLASRYALCYKVANSSSNAVPLLSPFVIGSLVSQVTVVSAAQVTGVTLTLQFAGKSLLDGDRAALVPSTATNCSGATYAQVSSVTGDTALLSTIVTTSGNYRACYQPQYGLVTFLPQVISISNRSVASVAFTRQPVCTAFLPCAIQPQVLMLDSNGNAASDPSASIELSLRLSNSAGGYVSNGLALPIVSALVSQQRFLFFDVTVLLSGTFILEARVTLIGGIIMTSTSAPFTVLPNANATSIYLQCTPAYQARPATTVSQANWPSHVCVILETTPYTPPSYAVTVSNGGVSTPVVSTSAITSTEIGMGVLSKKTFNVTGAYDDLQLNYFTVSIVPGGAFSSMPVGGSPVALGIVSTPDTTSTLDCVSTSGSPVSVSGVSVVRSGEVLTCRIQGRVSLFGGTLIQPIQTYGSAYIVYTTTNNDTSSTSPVTLPFVASDLNGLHVFTYTVPTGVTSVEVVAQLRNVVGTPPLVRSPQQFLVVGSPVLGTAVCTSSITRSTKNFQPGEVVPCVLATQDAFTVPIRSSGSDISVTVTGDATIPQPIPATAIGTTFTFTMQTPARTGTTSRRFVAQATGDQAFTMQSKYVPSSRSLTNSTFKLLYVTATNVPFGVAAAGNPTTVTLAGSGLSPTENTYVLNPTSECNMTGVSSPTVFPQRGSDDTALTLTFNTPAFSPFYICAGPQAGTVNPGYTLLSPQAFVHPEDESGFLTGTNLILFIVGVCLLACLLCILVLIALYLCCLRQSDSQSDKDLVRVNDQYIHSGEFDSFPPQPTYSKDVGGAQTQAEFSEAEDEEMQQPQRTEVPMIGAIPEMDNRRDSDNPLGDPAAQSKRDKKKKRKGKGSKKTVEDPSDDDSFDAEYTAPAAPPQSSSKRRVVDEDEESNEEVEFTKHVRRQMHTNGAANDAAPQQPHQTGFGGPQYFGLNEDFNPTPNSSAAPRAHPTSSPQNSFTVQGHTSVPMAHDNCAPQNNSSSGRSGALLYSAGHSSASGATSFQNLSRHRKPVSSHHRALQMNAIENDAM